MIRTLISNLIKKYFSSFFLIRILLTYKQNLLRVMLYNKNFSRKDAIIKGKILYPKSNKEKTHCFAYQFKKMMNKIGWICPYEYIYPFDPTFVRGLKYDITSLASISVDFKKVLSFDKEEIENNLNNCKNKEFRECEINILESIEILVNRIIQSKKTNNRNKEIFNNILNGRPDTLYGALQKILFFDALFWQAGHSHIGLGRLDYILFPYYLNDISKNILNREDAKRLIKDFCLTLGFQTASKSLALIGDTGQYILIGGIDQDGNNVNNEITEIFLEIFSENAFADPKLIMRANKQTSEDVWDKTIKCILKGTGSPLIMNEDIIIEKMVEFGYASEDVWNLGTSACWEPLIIGKSFDQNNPLPSVNLLEPLTRIIISNKCPRDFENLMKSYKNEIANEIRKIAQDIKFDCSPLFTLFFEDCISREKDFSEGGAIYNYHGMQAIGLPNVVNALLNLKLKIYDRQIFSIETLRKALLNNFVGFEDVKEILISGKEKFGKNDYLEVTITNEIMDFIDEIISEIQINGNKVKIGFSSPNYIVEGKYSNASADGRNSSEPLAVHISPTSSYIDFAEIVDFSASLNYKGSLLNGNVVDFIIPQSYIDFPQKLKSIIKDAISKGIFELQLNVLNKNVLIDAKNHPEKYPNLIVRVWGFSAYFNDLPESFKDNLIRRAVIYEERS